MRTILETDSVSPIHGIHVNSDWSGDAVIGLRDFTNNGIRKTIEVKASALANGEISQLGTTIDALSIVVIARAIALASRARYVDLLKERIGELDDIGATRNSHLMTLWDAIAKPQFISGAMWAVRTEPSTPVQFRYTEAGIQSRTFISDKWEEWRAQRVDPRVMVMIDDVVLVPKDPVWAKQMESMP